MVAIWSKLAELQLRRQIEYKREESLQNAEKVKADIGNIVDKIEKYPEHFSLEKYKQNNDGIYPYFEKHRLRISYRVTQNQVWIVRVRHTSMRPRYF